MCLFLTWVYSPLFWSNPGRFTPMTCSPRKVSRFVPLNRYYIIIDEVFFDNFFYNYLFISCMQKKNNNSFILVCFNYLFISCIQKNNNSFILVYFNYLFISCIQKNNNSFILVYFCQRSQAKLFLQNLQKTTQEQ